MRVHDEVCGMDIEAERAPAEVDSQGKTYYFCSDHCRGMFEEHPHRYVPVTDEGDEPGDHHHPHR